jgi:adenylosuccinate synthase
LVVLEDKLQLLRERSLQDVQELDLSDASGKLFDLSVKEEARRLYSIGYLNNDLPHCKTAIFEGAQGILLDEWRGFHPYTTWSTVTPEAALDLAAEYGAEVLVLGVTRAYMTRHGAGPFPTEWKISTLEDKGNPYNEWQGDLRCGWLDFALLEYALSVCKIDGWAVNCLDDLRDVVPYVNMRYGGYQLKAPALPSLKAQEHMTRELKHVKTELFPTTVSNILGQLEGMAPVLVKSNGPTHKHRTMSKLPPFRRVKSA